MKKWEYAALTLIWSGKNKGVTVTQYGQSKHFALASEKEHFRNNHLDRFNQIVGKLGGAGWELISISTLQGASYHTFLLDGQGNYAAESQAQEFWFKREVTDVAAPTIEHTLMYVFKEHKVSSPKDADKHFDYYNS
mgnify:FL=1